jgi:hypothetical protein
LTVRLYLFVHFNGLGQVFQDKFQVSVADLYLAESRKRKEYKRDKNDGFFHDDGFVSKIGLPSLFSKIIMLKVGNPVN